MTSSSLTPYVWPPAVAAGVPILTGQCLLVSCKNRSSGGLGLSPRYRWVLGCALAAVSDLIVFGVPCVCLRHQVCQQNTSLAPSALLGLRWSGCMSVVCGQGCFGRCAWPAACAAALQMCSLDKAGGIWW